MSEAAWLDNPQLAMQVALRQAEGGALFIANIARFFGRAESTMQMNAIKDLHKAIVENTCVVIGTATEADYNERIKPNASVIAHSHILAVPPATTDECIKMLTLHKPQFERDYGMTIDEGAIKTATTLAARYVGATPLPGSAMQVLHRACAIVKGAGLSGHHPQQVASGPMVSNQPAPDHRPLTTIDGEDVTYAISMMTGIPVTKLGEDERAKYAQMTEALQQRVIGQDDAILALGRAVKSARVGLKDPKRPIGSFFSWAQRRGQDRVGQGVGRVPVWQRRQPDRARHERISEGRHHQPPDRLTARLRGLRERRSTDREIIKSPYTVVLFDEVEKAHPRILDILLQVMEEGRLTDGQGRTANFAETVIILTSNLGAQYLNDPTLGDQAHELAMLDVKSFFRPEFLNRLDDVVMFKLLSPDVMAKILDLLIAKEAKLSQTQGIGIEVTPAARTWMLAQNKEPHLGARPLRRILQRSVRDVGRLPAYAGFSAGEGCGGC